VFSLLCSKDLWFVIWKVHRWFLFLVLQCVPLLQSSISLGIFLLSDSHCTLLLCIWWRYRRCFVHYASYPIFTRCFLFVHASECISVSFNREFFVSSASAGSWACALACAWWWVSPASLSSDVKCSSMNCKVSAIQLGIRVVIWVLLYLFPSASLYTSFHWLEDVVRLQYSFHYFIFSLLIVASYLPLLSK